MEDDTRGFLVMVVNTIAVVFIFMMAHVIAGIYFGLGFFDESPKWSNYLYYLIFFISLFYVIRYIKRKWKL